MRLEGQSRCGFLRMKRKNGSRVDVASVRAALVCGSFIRQDWIPTCRSVARRYQTLLEVEYRIKQQGGKPTWIPRVRGGSGRCVARYHQNLVS